MAQYGATTSLAKVKPDGKSPVTGVSQWMVLGSSEGTGTACDGQSRAVCEGVAGLHGAF